LEVQKTERERERYIWREETGEGLSERYYTFYHWGEMRSLQACRFRVGFRSSFWYMLARNKKMRWKVRKIAEL
jgi:hypothetical protein